MSVSDTLKERAKTYGDFRDIARISGSLQRVMHKTRNWDALPEDAREALQTIASKIARILNGDPEFIDSWHDIAGYATLVENRLRESEAKIDAACAGAFVPWHDIAAKKGPDAPPLLATPPDGYDVEYLPAEDAFPGEPWRARKKGGLWFRGVTRDASLDAAKAGCYRAR